MTSAGANTAESGDATPGTGAGSAAAAEGAAAASAGDAAPPPPTRRLEAEGVVKSHVIGVMAAGFVPVPVVDLMAVVTLQLRMTHRLCEIHGVPFVDESARSIILSLLSGIVPVTVGAGLASLVKALPGLGTFLGAASVSIIGGGTTYAVGQVFIRHFEGGGTLLDLNARELKTFFAQEFERGKAFAKTLRRDRPKDEAAAAADHETAAPASN